MKIGIIGIGSIGQRHVRCLKELGYSDIVAFRTKKGELKKLPDDLNYILEYTNENDFFELPLDGVIIANPTSMHIETMKKPLEKKIPVFVEKPMASFLNQIEYLKPFDTSKVMVGFCLRYHEIIKIVKKFLQENKLGSIYKATLYCGHYLPFWHPYADYTKEYYSKENLGGGVLRTLSHELDLAYYLFGEIQEICGVVEKRSSLKIDVDDSVIAICKMKDNSTVTIEIDYLNPQCKRNGIIFGSKGLLEYNFSGDITFTDYQCEVKTLYQNKKINPNAMFIEQMKDFVKMIKTNKPIGCTFTDGLYIMKIIDAIEKSWEEKTWKSI